MISSHAYPQQETHKVDRSVQGRPFDLEEFQSVLNSKSLLISTRDTPDWVQSGELPSDTLYYGIGKSDVSQEAADNDARLRFAQYVEVSVQSIAVQQIEENKELLEENYSYESLVSTNMNLRSVKISDRYLGEDSTFFSLISYGKSEYHVLVTQEIQISLETDIRKQELAHQAKEALSADSLRHKITMDSLTLSRKQAVIDSLDHILAMEESSLRQHEERIDLIKNRHASFLRIKPRYQLIDVPSAGIPNSWIYLSSRWNPDTENIRQLKAGASIWLFSAETNIWASEALVDQADLSIKLQLLPERGEIYPVSLALGWVNYLENISDQINLKEDPVFDGLVNLVYSDSSKNPNHRQSTFFVTATIGIPQYNNHLSIYADKRKVSLASIWYPFPRNMGDAISIINQLDVIRAKPYRNRFDDAMQWQLGLRLIAIPDRFATMVSYEDHEVWMLTFEFQY